MSHRSETIGRATLHFGDCRDVVPSLGGGGHAVVTDPPYGIGFAAQPTKWQRRAGAAPESWDDTTVSIVTKLPDLGPSIIWGGNYYALPPTRCWLSWFKPDAPPSMAHFELAWTSFDANSRQLSVSIGETNPERLGHPTQKPLRLMKWCLGFLPNPEKPVLDPFMGSGTTGVAAVLAGRSFVGVERDERYFEMACRRIDDAQRQGDFLLGGASA